ncbi:uncharacterized protein LOC109603013 [Aethina tumida]|uniref:uncharacterized protein LOC109603013 n=1 Tax=Aethina tumida TaxID=116153 RepID=UPI0021492283|nr:uncharacterized protein LOC109603013 [Aethina tumida]
MEKKLEEYRAKKLREKQYNEAKDKVKSYVMKFIPVKNDKKNEETHYSLIEHPTSNGDINNDESDSEKTSHEQESTYIIWILYILYFTLWITLYVIFIKLEFGCVYFLLSLLIGMFWNTRKKKPGEISAYSVFNEGCESIDGTLKAEQFEREIRYGAGSVK